MTPTKVLRAMLRVLIQVTSDYWVSERTFPTLWIFRELSSLPICGDFRASTCVHSKVVRAAEALAFCERKNGGWMGVIGLPLSLSN